MAAPVHPDMTFWRQRVRDWFPNLYRRTYFLPPVFLNRTQRREVQVAGQTVHVTEPPVSNLPRGAAPALHESFVREDATQVKVLRCLHQLSEAQGEVMFVISQLNFGHYLNQPTYAAAAAALPRPIDLKAWNKHRGDFDVLIILRHYGILVCEIKTIGDNFPASMTQQQQDQKIADKIRLSIKQLGKADVVLVHLVSDQSTAPRILKTLMLPNITTAQLQSVLAADPQLSQVSSLASPLLCLFVA